ncbi:hypothetical protein HHI36_004039 [Cryptolaemus montrouzieri]|uniref:C2H2-type domain-containing protein n=1 Tax=Cryptolaemus montrouzieri TaxID=559131 RepID=A0ABD2NQG1_9CUCU
MYQQASRQSDSTTVKYTTIVIQSGKFLRRQRPYIKSNPASRNDPTWGVPSAAAASRHCDNLTRIVFQCTWPSCLKNTSTCEAIEAHVRNEHLKDRVLHTGEEEFYYTEIELGLTSPPPTLSHRDMARPPYEDPEYQRQLVGTMRQNILSGTVPIIPQSPHKLLKLSPRPHSPKVPPVSPRRIRGENKKCRKVYGMEHREQWCTQCKWKKACSRFGD